MKTICDFTYAWVSNKDNQDYPMDLHIFKFRLFFKRVLQSFNSFGRTRVLNIRKFMNKYSMRDFLQGSSLSSGRQARIIYMHGIYMVDGYVSFCQNYFKHKIRLQKNSCK